MADRRRDDVAIIFEMVIVFFETAERASEIACDTGLLGNDKGFGHLEQEPKLSFAVIAIGKRKTRAILAQFHKIFPGNCFTSRFSSRRRRVEETIALGKSHVAAI